MPYKIGLKYSYLSASLREYDEKEASRDYYAAYLGIIPDRECSLPRSAWPLLPCFVVPLAPFLVSVRTVYRASSMKRSLFPYREVMKATDST